MAEFKIQSEALKNGVALVSIQGYLDAHTYEELEKAFRQLFDTQSYRVVVDLSKLEYISSAGAGVFVGAISDAQDNGGNIVVVKPASNFKSNVNEVFELLGLHKIFLLHNTREEAIKTIFQS